MKNNKHWLLTAGLLMTSVLSFAQKAVETSAAVEFKNNFQPAFNSGDMDKAKSSIRKAKDFIDAASAHEDTKESPKTLYYKGEIYFFLVIMKGVDSVAFEDVNEEQALRTSIDSYKKGYNVSNKMKADIEDAIRQKKTMLDISAVAAFNAKQYKDAMEAYEVQVELSSALNRVDTLAIYYAGVCAENNVDWDNAAKFYSKCADYGYKVPEIYKIVANAYIQGKKTEEATAFLEKAIQKSPKDKELYYVIGTFYMESGQNEKATENLRKAVEIDPKYWDAQYQLGAHLQSIGSEIRSKANALPLGDPNFDKLIAESEVYYKQAVDPLEAYLAANPKDRAVLQSLSQLHRALKNTEKAVEYKRRLDELN